MHLGSQPDPLWADQRASLGPDLFSGTSLPPGTRTGAPIEHLVLDPSVDRLTLRLIDLEILVRRLTARVEALESPLPFWRRWWLQLQSWLRRS